METTTTNTPPPAFSFAISLPPASTIDGSFAEVSGIDVHTDTEEAREGGANGFVHQLPGVTKHANLVLKRGTVNKDSALADWAAQSVGSTLGQKIRTLALDVRLLGPTGEPLILWTFDKTWPVKWEVAGFDAGASSILVETLEISYTSVTTDRRPAST